MARFHSIIASFFFIIFLTPLLKADFGVTTEKRTFKVDSGAGLVFHIDRWSGNMPSISWNGLELNESRRSSGINSGLGAKGNKVTAETKGDIILITVQTDSTNDSFPNFTQYYIVKKSVPTIFMATFATKEPNNGELRWITRLLRKNFSTVPEYSDLKGCTGNVESDDILGRPDKTTRSKFYGNQMAKDLSIRGVTGLGRGVFMYYGSRESSAGGPFFRDIQNQSGSNAEVYNYMNSGHNQTETVRTNILFGPYALCFTNGEKPKIPDISFIENLNLKGYVKRSERGTITIPSVTGMDSKFPYTLGFSNKDAQYWTNITSASLPTISPNMKPGTYTMTIYKGELDVLSEQVEVKAGTNNALPPHTIVKDLSFQKTLWRIGEWDGTPLEFRNGKAIPFCHPSDSRNAPWKTPAYNIPGSTPETFPACLFADVNNGQEIKFKLSSDQISNKTLRIGITASFAAARPVIHVNKWESKLPPAPRKIDSRSLTLGSYRGINQIFTYSIPAKALRAGENTIKLFSVSGSGAKKFLSASFSFDCIDLY